MCQHICPVPFSNPLPNENGHPGIQVAIKIYSVQLDAGFCLRSGTLFELHPPAEFPGSACSNGSFGASGTAGFAGLVPGIISKSGVNWTRMLLS